MGTANDAVFASRILGGGALRGGMPRYKYVANRLLTAFQNLMMGGKLSEYHTGYRAWSRKALEQLPLIACSDVGDPRLPTLSDDLDIRTDVPRYHIFRDGAFVEEVTDIRPHWRDDLVTFALGCSFSFEEALQEAGVRLKFRERNNVAAVYVTNVDTVPAGPFKGPLVVTMRAFTPADAIRAIQITSRFPNVHGAPVHLGEPKSIGVDLSRRYLDVGDPEVDNDELPVFWACGLTPQLAVQNARPPLCITHAPSSMLITDLRNASLAVL